MKATNVHRDIKPAKRARCPECNGKPVLELWAGDSVSVPVFCSACNATGFADGRATTSAQSDE